MLCHHIHRDFGQIQIGSDAGRRRDARLREDIVDHLHGKVVGTHPVSMKIAGDIHKNLINGVDMDILRRYVFQIDLINFRAPLHVQCHVRSRGNKVKLKGRVTAELAAVRRLPGKGSSMVCGSAPCIHAAHHLKHFEKTGASRNSVRLERGRDRKADCFLCTAHIRDDKIRRQRIKAALAALDRSVKRLEVNRDILFCPALSHTVPDQPFIPVSGLTLNNCFSYGCSAHQEPQAVSSEQTFLPFRRPHCWPARGVLQIFQHPPAHPSAAGHILR